MTGDNLSSKYASSDFEGDCVHSHLQNQTMKVPEILDFIKKIKMFASGMDHRIWSDSHYTKWRDAIFLLKWKTVAYQMVCFMFRDGI